jgi:O-antigen/teichoic acid export membrane protein
VINESAPPPGRKRATVLQALGGYANTAITIIQGLLLVPLYLHFLGSNTYGLWLASGGILGMLLLVNFGVGNLITQRVAQAYGQKNLSEAGSYFVNGMFVYFCICLLYGAIGWILSFWIPDILKVSDVEAELLKQCFRIALIAMTIGVFNECLRSFSQAMLRPLIPMIGAAVGRALGIVGTVWMLFDDFGLWAIPVGMLVAECLILIINIIYVLSLFRVIVTSAKLEKRIIVEYAKASPVLLLAKTGNALSQESEPLLITMLLNAEATTAYMVARKVADMGFQLISVINGSILGSFSHLAGEADSTKIKKVASSFLLLASIFSLIGFSVYVAVNNSFLTLWVGEEYAFDQHLILMIGVGFFSRAVRGTAWEILYSIGDFTYTSVVILLEGVCKIGLALLLLGMLGVAGVPYALALTGFLSFMALILRLVKLLSLELNRGFVLRMLFSVLACGLVIQLYASQESWLELILNTLLLTLALLLTVFLINRQVCIQYIKKATHGIFKSTD